MALKIFPVVFGWECGGGGLLLRLLLLSTLTPPLFSLSLVLTEAWTDKKKGLKEMGAEE